MPLLWLSAAFLTGIWLGSLTTIPKSILIAAFLLFAALAFLERLITPRFPKLQAWRRISPLPFMVLLAALALGAWRYPAPVQPAAGRISSFNDRGEITFSAVVTSLPIETDRSVSFTARVVPVKPGSPSQGMIQVQGWPGSEVAYGDLVTITGSPETPPENESFSYRDYLSHKGIHSLVSYPVFEVVSPGHGSPVLAALYRLRLAGYRSINTSLPQPDAALLSGILLGLDQDLPDDLTRAFQQTGTAHIIAISGFNIAIVSAFFYWLLRLIASRWKAAFFSILAVFLYALLVGAEPAVMRAAVMGSMAILGTQIGRRGAGLNTLVFTAAVMCLFNPYLLWDVSFQLSFAATLGLVVIGNPLIHWFSNWLGERMAPGKARQIAAPVGEYFLLTLAAQVATLPLMAWHFHQVSLSAILANPLILPAQPLIMTLGAAAMLAGMFLPGLGQALAWLVLPFLSYTIAVVEWFARLPWAVRLGGQGFSWIVFLLALAAGIYWLGKKYPAQLKPAALLAVTGAAAIVTWMAVAARPDGRLHITLLALKDGHGVLIRTPLGQSYLINGASSGRDLAARLDSYSSPFDRILEGLILTGRQSKPLIGLGFLAEQVDVDAVLWGAAVPANASTRRLEDTLRQSGASSDLLEAGQVYQLEPGMELRVLAASEEGTALLLDYGNFTLLLPGRIPAQDLRGAFRVNPPSLILLDAGDLESSTANDWADLRPLAILWNEAEQPAPDAEWIEAGEAGQVEVTTDGTGMLLERLR